MSKIRTFEDLMVHQLRDLLSSARQMTFLMPKMAELTQHDELRQILQERGERSHRHRELLCECLEKLGAPQTPETCHAMIGLITEGDHLLDEVEDRDVRDAAIIAIAQRIQHYEIAGYGTLKCHAEQLGERGIAEKVDVILKEEKKLDKKLSKLAESSVNRRAMANA